MDERDSLDLQRFGYKQQLRRRMGAFSSFAVAFSLISVFTGVFANFGHGLRQVGGGLVWSWLVVLGGQTLLALLLAELSTRIPLSGYGYQWTSRLEEEGLSVREGHYYVADLQRAEECFLTNTSMEIMPVSKVDSFAIGDGKPGPLTRRLQTRFADSRTRFLEPAS